MNVQKGKLREQMWIFSLDIEISAYIVVRLVDLLEGHIDLDHLSCSKTKAKKKGVKKAVSRVESRL